jgi:hypothetical protein
MLKFRPDRLSLERFYLSFIRPLLEHGDVVWDPRNMYLINILESVQIEAMSSLNFNIRRIFNLEYALSMSLGTSLSMSEGDQH